MLRQLTIRDFAIVQSLELDLATGFSAVTGETGAGKSIVVDAIALLLGERALADTVRHGAEKAELGALFEVATDDAAATWLRTNEIDDGDGEIVLRRIIGSNGRSRGWINGSPVTMQQLQSLGALLVEIHGQNQHLALTRPAEQLALLDAGLPDPSLREAVRSRHGAWRDAEAALARLEEDADAQGADPDYLAFQLQEFEDLPVTAEEVATLGSEHDLLSRAEAVQDALATALAALDDDEHGARSVLSRAAAEVVDFADNDPAVAEALRMIEEARINAQEAAMELQRFADRVEPDPRRLAGLDRTLGRLHDLARKHHVEVRALADTREEIAARLERLSGIDEERERLRRAADLALDNYREAAAALGLARAERAAVLEGQVTELMAELGMADGVFEVVVDHDGKSSPSPRGDDAVELRVSANPGSPPGALARVASGGELSRISLALRVATSSGAAGLHVFDEVDAGIGGETAHAVGRMLREVAAGRQALAVTHLAQVAAAGDAQMQVRKLAGDRATHVSIRLLDGTERVDEIARMLGGQLTEQSRAHAAELLEAARNAAA